MRGIILVLLLGALLLAGCINGPYDNGNVTNTTNITNITNKTKCVNEINYTCLNKTMVKKYMCVGGKGEILITACGKNKECMNGKCVDVAKPINTTKPVNQTINTTNKTVTPPKPTIICDGPSVANKFYKNNTVYNKTKYNDYCLTLATVKNYHCEGDRMISQNYDCSPEYECREGMCQTPMYGCTDKDGGNNTAERNKVIVLKGYVKIAEEVDICSDIGTVKEWTCAANHTATSELVKCGSGKKCLNGRCIRSLCSETDGGDNMYVQGTTTDNIGSSSDICPSNDQVREYYCYGDSLRTHILNCPKNMVCEMGACVEE